jgi:hypothetical protein
MLDPAAHADTAPSMNPPERVREFFVYRHIPTSLTKATGRHRIALRSAGKKEWERNLDVLKDSQPTIHLLLEPSQSSPQAINTAHPPHSKLTSPGATLVMNLLHMLNHSLLL